MRSNLVKSLSWTLFLSTWVGYQVQAQDLPLTLQQAMELGVKNHPKLAVLAQNINQSAKQKEVVSQKQLPNISFSAKAGYLADAILIEPDFSTTEKFELPHFENSVGLEATQLIYHGGLITKSKAYQDLATELARLNLTKNQQEIKFLIAGYYLELLRLENLKKVYTSNNLLAAEQLKNIQSLYKNGVVTQDEIYRSQLQMANIALGLKEVTSNEEKIQNQLRLALGLSQDQTLVAQPLTEEYVMVDATETYQALAHKRAPELLQSHIQVAMAEKQLEITKAHELPELFAYAGGSIQRPILNINPVLDMYMGAWSVGVGLHYDISSLFRSEKEKELNKINILSAKLSYDQEEKQTDTAIKNAVINYQLAKDYLTKYQNDVQLTAENYRIIEKKYYNQLAILSDLIGATSQQLEALIKQANAELQVAYQYYSILKLTGTL